MMTKKDFEALADALRGAEAIRNDRGESAHDLIRRIIKFCEKQNPLFNEERWLDYINGEPATARPVFYQHLRAPNSPNGNPQRLYMVYGSRGEVLRVVDEGYKGLPEDLRHVPQLPSVEIGRAEYHATKRQFSAQEA